MLFRLPDDDIRSSEVLLLSSTYSGFKKLLDDYADVFLPKLLLRLPPEQSHDFRIKLEKTDPPKRGVYSLCVYELEELRHQLNDLLQQGFTHLSKSPRSALILLATEKDGGIRLCVDCAALNGLAIKNSHAPPQLDDSFDKLREARHFTKLDLRSVYHQITL